MATVMKDNKLETTGPDSSDIYLVEYFQNSVTSIIIVLSSSVQAHTHYKPYKCFYLRHRITVVWTLSLTVVVFLESLLEINVLLYTKKCLFNAPYINVITYIIQSYSGITSGRVPDRELLYKLFHEDFSPIYRAR